MEVNCIENEMYQENESKYCNLRFLSNSLNSCLLDGDDIHLGHYLDAYKELKKFCNLMGSVFGFVASEIENKTGVLEQFRKEDECGNFVTMKNMIKHEKEKGVLKNINYISGCRTLLLLNRGLDFLRTFLRRASTLNPNEGTASIGKQSYEETLAMHHVWYIRAGTKLAMITMPTKQNLLNYVLGDTQEYMLQYLPEVIEAANRVYDRTYKTMKDYNLLGLA